MTQRDSYTPNESTQSRNVYPYTPTVDHTDDYHGQSIPDPYRWLEDIDTEQTTAWIHAQNQLSGDFFEEVAAREPLLKRLMELWDYEKFRMPFRGGPSNDAEASRLYLNRNDGLQNQGILYALNVQEDTSTTSDEVIIDPNTLSEDGTVAFSGYTPSDDGRYLAYGVSASGSDWQEWRIRSLAEGTDLDDHLKWIKFSGVSWDKESDGFYYSCYNEPEGGTELKDINYYEKLYYHRVGTPQSEDILIYERPDEKEWGFDGQVTADGEYLIISVWKGTLPENAILYKKLDADDDINYPVVELLVEFDASYVFIGSDGSRFYFVTDHSAPCYRIIAIDVDTPPDNHPVNHPVNDPETWHELVPESTDTLQFARYIHNTFIAVYLHHAHSRVELFQQDGTHERSLDLPEIGTMAGISGRQNDRDFFYNFTNFTRPTTVYRYDLETHTNEIFRQPQLGFDPDDYITKQIFYTSKDGTQVPMFICHKKELVIDEETPTYLYGYGGFNIALTPTFNANNIAWMELGGIYAQPSLRGGGEYGKAWHEAGTKHNKQNVFDDFITAAEWLIANDYTAPARLAIGGGSNGGLLVAACMTQRPDLFGACIPAVGVLDMLRYDKFTIGWAWVSDYGSPDDPEEFEALMAYSPYHNIKPDTAYPPTLITTGDHDDRVFPAHSFKFAAALQAEHSGPAPILLRVDTKAGHGAGKPISKIIEEAADRWAFVLQVLNVRRPISQLLGNV
ncbi:MAG: prolyl oligopeptidase family serine peptidase [Chloroflexota bacterium]